MNVYVVGGAVRDALLGFHPKDFDYVVVGASPEHMLEEGFTQVGADFPVFLHPETGEEFALARTERKSGNGYLGFEVCADETVTLEADLFRRDLTINAMAREAGSDWCDNKLIDPYGGLDDLVNKVLRHVSPAFAEDPLRVIRLARFYARYSDFKVAAATKLIAISIVEKGDLNFLPPERFWAELEKVFVEDQPDRFFSLLRQLNADAHIKFFSGLYGQLSEKRFEKLKAYALAVRHVHLDDRVMIHTALTAESDGPSLAFADARTQALHKNVQVLRHLSNCVVTADHIFNLLKQAKAWSDGPGIDDLKNAMVVAELVGERFILSQGQLLDAVFVTKKVTSAKYIHIFGPGKALGAAIELGRKEAIAKLFNLHDDQLLYEDESIAGV